MKKIDSVIAVAGWEERFALGVARDLEVYNPAELFVIVFEEYEDLTKSQRASIERLANERAVRYEEVRVTRTEPASVWKTLQAKFSIPMWANRASLVDISTMPREVIWWVFGALESAGGSVAYIYYRPGEYASGWVTRDTDCPRLVYQRSGVSDFSRETCLMLISGFDIDRAAQLVQFFEPRSIVMGLQAGNQYQNQVNNVARNRDALGRTHQVRFFEIDAYSQDHGLSAMEAAIAVDQEKYNIVAASLGPKLSAIALHHLNRKNGDLALAYAASRQINPKYSTGIGDSVTGMLSRRES